MSVKAMGRPFGCVVRRLRVGRSERAGVAPGVNRLAQAHAGQDRVAHKDDKRDQGEHDDDLLSRSHTRNLVLARRLLGGDHALSEGHFVAARLGLGRLGASGFFGLRLRRGGLERRRGRGLRSGLLGLRALGTQGGQLLTLAAGLFLGLAAGLLGAELFQLGALLGRQWLGLKLGHGTALSF
nr:MAG TPA_asm: hypothetical protein [Caudoviricetes sp.]